MNDKIELTDSMNLIENAINKVSLMLSDIRDYASITLSDTEVIDRVDIASDYLATANAELKKINIYNSPAYEAYKNDAL